MDEFFNQPDDLGTVTLTLDNDEELEHDGEEEPELITIESDEEYEIASDGFDEWLDNLEFEELPTVE